MKICYSTCASFISNLLSCLYDITIKKKSTGFKQVTWRAALHKILGDKVLLPVSLKHRKRIFMQRNTLTGLRRTCLVDDVDAVVELLPLEDWVQVIQPELEVLVSFPEGDDDGHFLQGYAVFGFKASSLLQRRVLIPHQIEAHWRGKLDSERAHCNSTESRRLVSQQRQTFVRRRQPARMPCLNGPLPLSPGFLNLRTS